MQKAKKGKKQRKVGRNAPYCLSYKNSHRREKNKIERLKRHLKRYPDDKVATAAIEPCLIAIRGY